MHGGWGLDACRVESHSFWDSTLGTLYLIDVLYVNGHIFLSSRVTCCRVERFPTLESGEKKKKSSEDTSLNSQVYRVTVRDLGQSALWTC